MTRCENGTVHAQLVSKLLMPFNISINVYQRVSPSLQAVTHLRCALDEQRTAKLMLSICGQLSSIRSGHHMHIFFSCCMHSIAIVVLLWYVCMICAVNMCLRLWPQLLRLILSSDFSCPLFLFRCTGGRCMNESSFMKPLRPLIPLYTLTSCSNTSFL